MITGSNGLLGQKLVKKLRQRDDIELIATSRGDNRLQQQDGYQYESLDIADSAAVESLIARYKPDSLIHTAAMTHVDRCHEDPDTCHKMNIDAVKGIAEACKKHGVHLVQLSTDFIFDGENGPYTEEDQPNPVSIYGESKLKGEEIIRESGIDAAILRTILVYGVAENMSRSNIVLWAKGALEGEKSINVVDDQYRSPTLAEDLADACILAATKRAKGVYNISGGETFSVLELVWRVAEFWNLDKGLITAVSSETLSQPAKRPPRTGFIIDKAQRELGFKPHSFEEGLGLVDEQLKAESP